MKFIYLNYTKRQNFACDDYIFPKTRGVKTTDTDLYKMDRKRMHRTGSRIKETGSYPVTILRRSKHSA